MRLPNPKSTTSNPKGFSLLSRDKPGGKSEPRNSQPSPCKGNDIVQISVDLEDFDLEVLQSNDWSKYRPKFVLDEILQSSLENLDQDPLVRFMKNQNFIFF